MTITCKYCRANNTEDDNRCQRCGRRLHTPQPVGAGFPVSNTATARAIRPSTPPQFEQQREVEPTFAEDLRQAQADATPRRPIFQRSLFSSRDLPQVVPFESIAPRTAERARQKSESSRPRTRAVYPGQQTLEFSSPNADLEPNITALSDCNSPVAIPAHRVMAAAVDLSIIAIAMALFLGVFQLTLGFFNITGVVTFSKQTMPFFVGIAAVFGLLYKILWCLANGDTAGMRWAQLRLVNFDGQIPDREQRIFRVAAGFLSTLAAGLGLMWALVDEESLTWHDHISRTFPTPY